MRLSEQHRQAILQVVTAVCGPHALVRLFGSRLDDGKRGGDVDLMVELPFEPQDIFALQRDLHVKLLRALDERPVDVLVVGPQTYRQRVHQEAISEGVLL